MKKYLDELMKRPFSRRTALQGLWKATKTAGGLYVVSQVPSILSCGSEGSGDDDDNNSPIPNDDDNNDNDTGSDDDNDDNDSDDDDNDNNDDNDDNDTTGLYARGNVKSFDAGNNLANVLVTLTALKKGRKTKADYSAKTDSSGNWEITDLPAGDYSVLIEEDKVVKTFESYRPGKLRVNAQKESEGKLEKDCKLFRQDDRQFRNEVQRYNNRIVKWNPPVADKDPEFDIYTIEYKYQNPVPQEKIDGVIETIQDQSGGVATFYRKALDKINIIDAVPPTTYPSNGKINVWWDNNLNGGGNLPKIVGNSVVSGISKFDTDRTRTTWMEEICAVLIGSGESNRYPSVFNNGNTNETLQPKDYVISESQHDAVYSRAAGNQDLGSSNYRDVDPQDGIWNN